MYKVQLIDDDVAVLPRPVSGAPWRASKVSHDDKSNYLD